MTIIFCWDSLFLLLLLSFTLQWCIGPQPNQASPPIFYYLLELCKCPSHVIHLCLQFSSPCYGLYGFLMFFYLLHHSFCRNILMLSRWEKKITKWLQICFTCTYDCALYCLTEHVIKWRLFRNMHCSVYNLSVDDQLYWINPLSVATI